jgi:hypothetical protein
MGSKLGPRRGNRLRLVGRAVPRPLVSGWRTVDCGDNLDPRRPTALGRDAGPEGDAARRDLGLVAVGPDPRLADVTAPFVSKNEPVAVDAFKGSALSIDRCILDLEEVRKVGAGSQRDLWVDRLGSMVQHGQLFEEAVADDTPADHRQGRVRVLGTRARD